MHALIIDIETTHKQTSLPIHMKRLSPEEYIVSISHEWVRIDSGTSNLTRLNLSGINDLYLHINHSRAVHAGSADEAFKESFVLCIYNPLMKFLADHPAEPVWLVGHNVKFDMLWLNRLADMNQLFAYPNLNVWDTQIGAYTLSGQELRMPPLGEVAAPLLEGLELPSKGSLMELTNGWELETDEIPAEVLREYNNHDVALTLAVFQDQYRRIHEAGMLPAFLARSNCLAATMEMELRGLRFDVDAATSAAVELMSEVSIIQQVMNVLHDRILDTLSELYQLPLKIAFASKGYTNKQTSASLSALLFGGTLKYTVDEPVLEPDGTPAVYKTGLKRGQPKTRKGSRTLTLPPLYRSPRPIGASGNFPVDIETLEWLADPVTEHLPLLYDGTSYDVTGSFIAYAEKAILERSLTKDLTTYFNGYVKLSYDGFLYPKLLTTSTATGRLSCASPNLQNVTHED